MADSLERIINYRPNDFQWQFLGQRLNETSEPNSRQFDD